METIIILHIFGIVWFVVGVGILVNPKKMTQVVQKFIKNEELLFFGGMVSLFIGATMLSIHNRWGSSWEIVVTLLACSAILKGFFLAAMPHTMEKLTLFFWGKEKTVRVWGLVITAVGAFLLYNSTGI